MIILLAALSCGLALVPCLLFVRNLALYRPLPPVGSEEGADEVPGVSVLIPARNEEGTIGGAVRSVLASTGVELEVIVLDDASTDRTAEEVRAIADPRVRLIAGEPLPAGWCGKPFACRQLAQVARHPVLVFLDADVRVQRPDALARLARFMADGQVALASGVPFEETHGLMERLVIPLIHFVLLGFLPLARMRRTRDPRFAAACGQIVAVARNAYERAGGHATVADRLHDGVALARSFRRHGLATDLFDATDTFSCRMYRSGAEVWNGFARNAHEALAAPPLIVPTTVMLLGGQVLPLWLLWWADAPWAVALAALGTCGAYLPRLLGVVRFRQSLIGALLHPLGVMVLVAIQWVALMRLLRRRPAVWKGRAYPAGGAAG